MDTVQELFTTETLEQLFPVDRTNAFFEALFGDAEEGAYDIRLIFDRFVAAEDLLVLNLELHERPGNCLACNLTYGLPEVFSRHPVINISGLVQDIDTLLGDSFSCEEWRLAATRQETKKIHVIPLEIVVRKK